MLKEILRWQHDGGMYRIDVCRAKSSRKPRHIRDFSYRGRRREGGRRSSYQLC
jgi:hypothetical protein